MQIKRLVKAKGEKRYEIVFQVAVYEPHQAKAKTWVWRRIDTKGDKAPKSYTEAELKYRSHKGSGFSVR